MCFKMIRMARRIASAGLKNGQNPKEWTESSQKHAETHTYNTTEICLQIVITLPFFFSFFVLVKLHPS